MHDFFVLENRESIIVKHTFKYHRLALSLITLILLALPGLGNTEPQLKDYEGAFVILINDLITVDEKGKVITHVTERDANLNIQAQVKGTIRADENGMWHFKKGQSITFPGAKLFLTNKVTAPVTLEVLTDELDPETETQDLPVLIKGEHDPVGQRFNIRINGNMLAGILLKP